MPNFDFGKLSPEELRRAREKSHKEAAEERAKRREALLEQKMKKYFEPFYEIRTKFKELRKKYEEEPSLEELERLANSIFEVYIKKGKETDELEIMGEAINKKNLYRFMRERHALEKILDKSEKEFYQMIIQAQADQDLFSSTSFKEKKKEWYQFNQEIVGIINKDLPNRNPESFMVHYLSEIKRYKEELSTGIVETETVQERKKEIIDRLTNNGVVALVGETGTGKTRIAMKIANELTGGYEFAMGHAKMTREELISYLGIEPQTIDAMEVPRQIEVAQERYIDNHSDLTDEQMRESLKWVKEVILGQAKDKQLETKIILAPVAKAAEEGKIVIIDEFNFIPPEVFGVLNAFIDAKPGEIIPVMKEKIRVKEGFGVILTGNISKGKTGSYLKRQDLDPAFINRLNSGLLEYGTLPQEYDKSLQNSIIKQEELQKGKEPPKRELFKIGLAHLADRKGYIKAPSDALEQLWLLSKEFIILQKIFTGEPLRPEFTQSESGTRFNLMKYHASMRNFGAILEEWKGDAFSYQLDWYIYNNLIRPAFLIAPTEAAQMFYVLKRDVGFFEGREWKDIQVDSSTWKISGLEKINEETKKNFKLTTKQEKEKQGQEARVLEYLTPQQIAEATSGIRMPEPEMRVKEKEDVFKKREMIETYKNLEEQIKRIEKMVNTWEESIELFCQDEEYITSM